MLRIRARHVFILLGVLIAAIVASCSQESNSLLSKGYHNTTARFNAYFLANERYMLVDERVWENQKDDYNQILPYYPEFDTNFSKSLDLDLRYAIEKCKLPINKHKNSHWLDDSYILIGKSLFYLSKFDSAAQVFRFANTKSPDDNARHEALIWLLRTYLIQGEETFAYETFNYLGKEKLNQKNQLQFCLTSFEYYRKEDNYEKMLENIEAAIPMIRKSDRKSRAHFIAGQLRQHLNDEAESYNHYKLALKRNPPYELSFQTKLNMSQVTQVEKRATVARTYKTFNKLLKDLKNEEFKDRIYYEMARFELKRGNVGKCIALLKKSLRENGASPNQKAYSHLLMGKVHYENADSITDKVLRYTTSKLYYDSTVSTMSDDFRDHDEIIERKDILTDFVDQITTIHLQDSLLWMVTLPEEEQVRLIEERIAKDEAKLKADAERKAREEQLAQAKPKQNLDLLNSTFTLYDPVALDFAKAAFQERWGERPLEDHWRRSSKELIFNEIVEETIEDTVISDTVTIASVDSNEFKVDRNGYFDQLPKTDAAKQEALAKVEEAMYRLGKIYDFQLLEPQNAIATFDEHLQRFPESEYEAEILYMQYLLCISEKTCDPDKYKQQEFLEYPNSIYTKLMQDENYLMSNQEENQRARAEYETAFRKYNNGDYLGARQSADRVIQGYPNNDIMDHAMLMRIITFAKTDQWAYYDQQLKNFREDFKTSDLIPYVESLILQNANTIGLNTSKYLSQADTNFVKADTNEHYLIATFTENQFDAKRSLPIFYEFHATYYENVDFNTRRVEFTDSIYLVTVKSFNSLEDAKSYKKKLIHFNEFKKHLEKVDYNYYLISPKNYSILLKTKDLENYDQFHRKNY